MDPWVRMIIMQAASIIAVLVDDKTIKLSKKDIAVLKQIRDSITTIIGK